MVVKIIFTVLSLALMFMLCLFTKEQIKQDNLYVTDKRDMFGIGGVIVISYINLILNFLVCFFLWVSIRVLGFEPLDIQPPSGLKVLLVSLLIATAKIIAIVLNKKYGNEKTYSTNTNLINITCNLSIVVMYLGLYCSY